MIEYTHIADSSSRIMNIVVILWLLLMEGKDKEPQRLQVFGMTCKVSVYGIISLWSAGRPSVRMWQKL